MLVTWGQGGIPFAGNVALSQTRLSDDKVLLDWNEPEVQPDTEIFLRCNDKIGDYDNGEDLINEGNNSQIIRCYTGAVGSYVIGKTGAVNRLIETQRNISGPNIPGIRHVGGSTIPIQSFGFRILYRCVGDNSKDTWIIGTTRTVWYCRKVWTNRIVFGGGGGEIIGPIRVLGEWYDIAGQYIHSPTASIGLWVNGVWIGSRNISQLASLSIPTSSQDRVVALQDRIFDSSATNIVQGDNIELFLGERYADYFNSSIPTRGINYQTGTVTLLNSPAAGKLTAIDAIATGKITKIEHYNDNWSTIASNSAGLTFPLTGIDMVSSGLFRVTLTSTDTELQRDTPELISFLANIEPAGGKKLIQPFRFGPKLTHIGGIL